MRRKWLLSAITLLSLAALAAIGMHCFIPAMARKAAHHELLSAPAVAGRHVEIYWQAPKDQTTGKHPAILFVHGIQGARRSGGLEFVKAGLLSEYAKSGLFAASVSLPGYGQSDGEFDFCGKSSQDNLAVALDFVRNRPDVDPKQVAVLGISCGAVTAGVGARNGGINALILVSGCYDFGAMIPQWRAGGERPLAPTALVSLDRVIAQAGSVDKASEERSLLPFVAAAFPPTLLLIDMGDRIVDPKQSVVLHEALDRAHFVNELRTTDAGKHPVPMAKWKGPVNAFLNRNLGTALETHDGER